MKKQTLVLALTALFVAAACSSTPKEEAAPAPTPVAEAPAPAPTPEAPQNETQACEGKAAKDACGYAEVKGSCVRGSDNALKCMAKKEKAVKGKKK